MINIEVAKDNKDLYKMTGWSAKGLTHEGDGIPRIYWSDVVGWCVYYVLDGALHSQRIAGKKDEVDLVKSKAQTFFLFNPIS